MVKVAPSPSARATGVNAWIQTAAVRPHATIAMPSASANSATPPSTASCVWPIYSNAPASGAATQTVSEQFAQFAKIGIAPIDKALSRAGVAGDSGKRLIQFVRN